MYKLILFFRSHKHWFLWLLLQIFALLLLFNSGGYHSSLKNYGVSVALGRIREAMTEIHSYLNLRDENRLLLEKNALLEHSYLTLLRSVRDAEAAALLPNIIESSGLESIAHSVLTARVVNRRSAMGEVYYIINRGEDDGVRVDMPVMSANGVLGTVMSTSSAYAIVIPIINSKLKLSCVVKNKGYQGTLSSSGLGANSILGGIPMHSRVESGDTLLTSGLSYIYPEGLLVGVVDKEEREGVSGAETAFGTYKVTLATDFERLNYVYVLLTPPMNEAKELEQSTSLPE